MKDSNIIGFGTAQNPELIKSIEYLLKEAKEGRITALSAVYMHEGSIDFELDYGDLTRLEMIGGIEMLKAVILAPLLDDDIEEE